MNTTVSTPSNRYRMLLQIWKELSLTRKSSEDGKYMRVFRADDLLKLEGEEHDQQSSVIHSAPTA